MKNYIRSFSASPQLLYQRPYDPVIIPLQNQQMAVANPPMMALSQPSYAPPRVTPAAQPQGANMFRHALLRVRLVIFTSHINHFLSL